MGVRVPKVVIVDDVRMANSESVPIDGPVQ